MYHKRKSTKCPHATSMRTARGTAMEVDVDHGPGKKHMHDLF